MRACHGEVEDQRRGAAMPAAAAAERRGGQTGPVTTARPGNERRALGFPFSLHQAGNDDRQVRCRQADGAPAQKKGDGWA